MGSTLYPFGDDYEIASDVTTKYIAVDGLGLIAKRVNGETFWLHTDRLGSVHVITDSDGVQRLRRTYRPYGSILHSEVGHSESRGYIGQREDPETALLYLHARYYDPALGVFLSPDPAGPMAGVNAYGYSSGDPVNRRDPSGLADESELTFQDYYEVTALPGAHPWLVQLIMIAIGDQRRQGSQEPSLPNLPSFPLEVACPAGGGKEGCPNPQPAPAPPPPPAPLLPLPLPPGHGWARNTLLLADFTFGTGGTTRWYDAQTPETVDMQHSIGANKLRKEFVKKGCRSFAGGVYPSGQAWWDTLANPSTFNWFSTAAQVGGFGGAQVQRNPGDTITFTIPNEAGLNSFAYHAWPRSWQPATGPFRSIHQTFRWTEGLPDACN